jgi:membrane associated rhomboid family serine protease
MTWIVFRWKKVPREAKSQRNCQLSVVLVSVAITLAFSFTPAVDWAAHFGGALMGLMSSIVLVTNELDNERNKSILRYATLLASLVVWAVALIYLTRLEPARDTLEYF